MVDSERCCTAAHGLESGILPPPLLTSQFGSPVMRVWAVTSRLTVGGALALGPRKHRHIKASQNTVPPSSRAPPACRCVFQSQATPNVFLIKTCIQLQNGHHDSSTNAAVPRTPTSQQPRVYNPAYSVPIPFQTPLHDKSNQQQYQNRYVATPKEPAHKLYQLSSTLHKRQRAFAVADRESIAPINPLSSEEWDIIARQAGLIPPDGHVRPLQIECLNIVVSGRGDICAIGPMGCRKSLLWVLPLHAMGGGISLVVTPYTSLGCEGETNIMGKKWLKKSFFCACTGVGKAAHCGGGGGDAAKKID
ncbi:hypothetical protein K438DRAFT_1755564 [Mycena galopus ATCC 62051]|nr:hypothetical protein K438DRAFT_1755564 [Mycena galopus ATCC 62051]